MSDGELARYRSALLLLARVQLARRKLTDVDATALVQQTLLVAQRECERFADRSDEELFAWLRKILYFNFLEACAKARVANDDGPREALETDLTRSFGGLDELLIATQSLPNQQPVRVADLTRLAEALEQLPEPQRDAVILRHLVGLSFKNLGERLDCTSAATAGLLARGRQRLHELLEGS